MAILIQGITIEQLREAQKIVAKVVALYGDKYLLLFERLHREISQAEEAMRIKLVALQIAHRNSY